MFFPGFNIRQNVILAVETTVVAVAFVEATVTDLNGLVLLSGNLSLSLGLWYSIYKSVRSLLAFPAFAAILP